MSKPTLYFLHPQVSGSWTDWYAIISGVDFGAGDGNAVRGLDVNAVGVGTVFGGYNCHVLNPNVVAAVDDEVHSLAVYWR